MKNLKLTNLNYSELSSNEMSNINGGGFGLGLLLGALGAAINEIITDWDNFERGLAGKKYQPN